MRLKFAQLFAFALGLVVVSLLGSAAAGDKQKSPLEGAWRTFGEQPDASLIITGNKFVLKKGGEEWCFGTAKVDGKQTPKTIDLAITGSNNPEVEKFVKGKELTFVGIYEVEGDKLKWCAQGPGKLERPKDFPEKQGDGKAIYFIFEREKK